MTRYDTTCNVCSARDFHPFGKRSDGINVIACSICGHGTVEQSVEDVASYYGDDYFGQNTATGVGYEEYEYTAEQGVAWAAALSPLLRSSGRVLDIGCANGRLLELMGQSYDRFGIELNGLMAAEAGRKGIRILGHDLMTADLAAYREQFDLVLAIAVLEHIQDFRGSIERALQLLKPDGVLLFEVPLIRGPGDVWFRSSFEHIHYPTEPSLEYLFDQRLGLHLGGSVLEVDNYGCVYIGLTSKCRNTAEEASRLFDRLTGASLEELAGDELRFRWLYDLVHGAKTTPELVRASSRIASADLTPLVLRRLFDLWAAREERGRCIEQYLGEVEKARDWHASQTKSRDAIIANQMTVAQSDADRPGLADSQGEKRGIEELRAERDRMAAHIQDLEDVLNSRSVRAVRRLTGALARRLSQ